MKKDTKKVRGSATFFDNGDMEFTAYKEGTPQQEVLKQRGKSKLYRTTSADKPQLCAHLLTDADAPDAAARLEDQLEEFIKGFTSRKPRTAPTQRDRTLWDDEGVRVWYDAKDKAVKVNLSLTVEDGKNYEQETLNKISKVYQCFTINRQYLVQRGRALQKTSNA